MFYFERSTGSYRFQADVLDAVVFGASQHRPVALSQASKASHLSSMKVKKKKNSTKPHLNATSTDDTLPTFNVVKFADHANAKENADMARVTGQCLGFCLKTTLDGVCFVLT